MEAFDSDGGNVAAPGTRATDTRIEETRLGILQQSPMGGASAGAGEDEAQAQTEAQLYHQQLLSFRFLPCGDGAGAAYAMPQTLRRDVSSGRLLVLQLQGISLPYAVSAFSCCSMGARVPLPGAHQRVRPR